MTPAKYSSATSTINMIVVLFFICISCAPLTLAATGTLLSNQAAMYPRAILLQHNPNNANNGMIMADVTQFNAGNIGAIYLSNNNGTTFTQVGAVSDPDATGGLCCTVLFELPVQVGSIPAGTLLWAGSIGQNSNPRKMKINMWQSQDLGRTWKFVSSPAVAANTGGLWEPEFSVDATNQLVCHFSDETEQPHYSQLLQEVFSKDGITWSQRYPTVASTNSGHRPGMANVRQLSPSLWIMTYELCGTGDRFDCAAHFRTATNGQNWGDPANLGTLIMDNYQRYFQHAPTIAFSPNRNLLVLGGQILSGPNGVDMYNGVTLFGTSGLLNNGWTPYAKPIHFTKTFNDPCPNYSSALLFLNKGTKLFEVATDYNGPCMAYYSQINE